MVRDRLAESIDAAAKLQKGGKTIRAGDPKSAAETPAKKAVETDHDEAVAAPVGRYPWRW